MPQKDIYQELLQERRQQGNYQEKEFSTLDSQPVKRAGRSRWRALGMSAAAAVVVLTILSWAVLSAGLRHSPQNTRVAKQQADFHTGALLCSFSDNNNNTQVDQFQSSLDWSANGQVTATYNNLKTFAAHNCAQSNSFSETYSPSFAWWSPDGKRLLISANNTHTDGAEVLNASTGKVLATFFPAQGSTSTGKGLGNVQPPTIDMSFMGSLSGGPNPQNGATQEVSDSVWSADGTQVISAIIGSNANEPMSAMSVQIWNTSTGTLVRTAIKFSTIVHFIGYNGGQDQGTISPDGKYVAVQTANGSIQIWSIATGKLVSTIPFTTIPPGTAALNLFGYLPSAVAWSPDSSSLALASPNSTNIQVWSVTNGQLTTTFHDSDDVNPKGASYPSIVGTLSWSPDGKYLAESAVDIHIWDVNANKLVATFGKVATGHWISALAWSPDSKMLASNDGNPAKNGDYTLNKVNVWQLA